MEHDVLGRLRPITSPQHPLIKALRAAFARSSLTDDGCCAIEGVHLLEEALRSGLRLRAAVFSRSAEDVARKLLPQLGAHVDTLVVPDALLAGAVATETPQGVAGLVKLREFSLDDVLRAPSPLVVLVAGLQDPGNLGTILRSAEAFGAAGVLLAENTVRHFNPKALRASAGSVFRLPVALVGLEPALAALRARGVRLLGTSSHKGTRLDEADLSGGVAILIGNEGSGLPRGLLAAADLVVAIPHSPRVESLNAGIAASIVLYEASRQRRNIHTGGAETQR